MSDPTHRQWTNLANDCFKRNAEGKKRRARQKQSKEEKKVHKNNLITLEGLNIKKTTYVFCPQCDEKPSRYKRTIDQEFNICGRCGGKCEIRSIQLSEKI